MISALLIICAGLSHLMDLSNVFGFLLISAVFLHGNFSAHNTGLCEIQRHRFFRVPDPVCEIYGSVLSNYWRGKPVDEKDKIKVKSKK